MLFVTCFIVSILIGGAIACFFYFKDKKYQTLTFKTVSVLFFCRMVVASILSLLLFNPIIQQSAIKTVKPILFIAQDNSMSIALNKDSLQIKTEYLKALNTMCLNLSNEYEVVKYQFDSDIKPFKTIDFKGKETNLSAVFNKIESMDKNQKIAAIIMATDGNYNTGFDVTYQTAKLNLPIYTIALGDTAKQSDVWIQKIKHNEIVFLNNEFSLEVIVNAKNLSGKVTELSIFENNVLVKKAPVIINNSQFTNTYKFSIPSNSLGVHYYSVQLQSIKNDQNKLNNSQSFAIETVNVKNKILILAQTPHPDIACLVEILKKQPSFEIELAFVNEFKNKINPYSLIILHQINELPNSISTNVEFQQKPLFLINSNFPLTPSTTKFKHTDVETSATLNLDFKLFILNTKLKDFISLYPPIINQNIQPTTIATNFVLMYQKHKPLFYFNEMNNTKQAVFTGNGLWLWRMHHYKLENNFDLFDELIFKTIQYLSTKADKSFFRAQTEAIIDETEEIKFNVELFNQSYEPITEPDVKLTLTDAQNKKYEFMFNKQASYYSINAGFFSKGTYQFEASTVYQNKTYFKKGQIIINEFLEEKQNSSSNQAFLYQLSKQSNGAIFYSNQFNNLQDSLLKNKSKWPNELHEIKEYNSLINLKWLLFLAILFLGFEWGFRKYNGLI